MALRLVRVYAGNDGQSHFDVGEVVWQRRDGVNAVSALTAVEEVSFEETAAGSSLDWHNAPCRQYVITLSGRLEFETRGGAMQVIEPGDILLAEDTTGGGHRWRRVYVTVA
jgi:quercetin dioxygenase-like cupin family protein